MMLKIPEILFKAVVQQVEKNYPEESCGLLLGPQKDPEAVTRIEPCCNIQEKMHQSDPTLYTRDARTGYSMDPKDLLRIQKEVRQRREEIRVIYHSHIDTRADFSELDKQLALFNGEPLYPRVVYWILSIQLGQVRGWHQYQWDSIQKDFVLLSQNG